MSAPNPTMIIFPRIQAYGGYLECRMIRVTNFNPTINYYSWTTSHPLDCAYIDQRGYLGENFGKIISEYKDELSRLRLDSMPFIFNDDFYISGKDGAGNPIPLYNYAQDGKTFYSNFFNDKTDKTIYILWTTLYDSPSGGTVLKISFTGDINKNSMPDQALLIRNDAQPANLLRFGKIQMSCVPIYDRLTQYSMRDIGIYNHFQNGIDALSKGDMTRTAANQCAPFWAGIKAFSHVSDLNPSFPDASIGALYGIDPITSITNFGSIVSDASFALFLDSHDLTVNSVFKDIGGGININGVPVSSFRNGCYGVSFQSISNKLAYFCGCDPTIPVASDNTVHGIRALWNNTNKGYDALTATTGIGDFNAVYDILFGISPVPLYFTSSGVAVGSPIKVSLPLPSGGGTPELIPQEGQEFFIEGASDPAINGIWSVSNVVKTTPAPSTDLYTFDAVGSVGTGLTSSTGTFNYLFSTPLTYSPNDKADVFLKEICRQLHYKVRFGITQSGINIGMPYFKLISRWKAGLPISAEWKQGKIFDRVPRRVASDCVEVSLMGSDMRVVCPAGAKLPPIILPPLRWGSHQWGDPKGVFPASFTFNGDRSAIGSINDGQNSTSYTGNATDFPLDDDGWISGRFLYQKPVGSDNTFYPPVWATHSNTTTGDGVEHGGLTSTDWDGFFAYHALIWLGDGTFSGVVSPNQFNPLFDVARLAYRELVEFQELYKRDFAFVLYSDDLSLEYEDSWNENGVLVKYRMTRFEYNQLEARIETSDWEQSPVDYTSLDSVPACAFYGKGSSSGGTSNSGGVNTSGGNVVSETGNFIEKNPSGAVSNSIIPPLDTTLALRLEGHSLTQSANLLEAGTWDGTTFINTSGISPDGDIFLKNDGTDQTRLLFYNTAKTFATILIGNTSIAADVVFTLMNALPAANNYVVVSSTGGVLSLVDVNTLVTDANDIVTNPTATQIIQPLNTGAVPLKIKGFDTSVHLFDVLTSANKNVFYISPTGDVNVTNVLILNATGGVTKIGLDTGSAIDFGTIGQGLVSGSGAGLAAWINIIKENPTVYAANLLKPSGDTTALTINGKNLATGKILSILQGFTEIETILIDSAAHVFLGDTTDISGEQGLLRINQGANNIHGAILKSAASPFAYDLVRFLKNDNTVQGKIGQDLDIVFGDVANANTNYSTLQIIQRSAAERGVIFKQAATPSANLLEAYNSANTLELIISPETDIRTLQHISIGDLTDQSTTLSVNQTLGSIFFKNKSSSVLNEQVMDSLTTGDNAWHTVHAWSTAADKNYIITCSVNSKQTTNGNLLKGHGAQGTLNASFQRIGAALAQNGGTRNATDNNLANAPANSGWRFNVNAGTLQIELQFNGGAAETVIADVLAYTVMTT